MKKQFVIAALSIFMITSCQSENEFPTTKEDLQTVEMKNFNDAFKNLGKPENKPTDEERRSGSAELSDRRKKTLVPSSIALIKSTGVSENEIQRKTNGDITAIIVWATQINLEKNNRVRNQIKAEN